MTSGRNVSLLDIDSALSRVNVLPYITITISLLLKLIEGYPSATDRFRQAELLLNGRKDN
jgi:hypothetical protein